MVVIDGVNYLTVGEVCQLLQVKPATIYAYVSRGILRSYKQGIKRQRLYREDEVRVLMEIQPSERPPEPESLPARVEVVERLDEGTDEGLPPAERWMSEI